MPSKDLYIQLSHEDNDLPLFHKSWWLDATSASWDAVMVKKGNRIAGVWPFRVESKKGITMSRNHALTPYLGPYVFFPPDLKESKKDNYEHDVINELIGQLPPFKVWDIACIPGMKQIGLFKEKGFAFNFRQTFLMDLQEAEEAIFSRLHEDFRRSVRKVAAEMTITNEPAALHLLYDFQVSTLVQKRGVGINYSFSEIESLFNTCVEHDACALWVARKQDVVQAVLWNMWDQKRGYYLVGSKNPEVNDNHGMTALIWQAIKHSKSLGKVSMDFEGSMVPGVERFFRTFGGRREIYPILQKNRSFAWKVYKMVRRN
jgi:hypothetical protein